MTTNLKKRWHQHESANGSAPALHAAIQKYGKDSFVFTSEIKASPHTNIIAFPPGFYAKINMITLAISFVKYHIIEKTYINDPLQSIRNSLINAVKIRMMTERPIAALLSGGLDSSLIAALLQKELKKANKPPLKTFSIGFEGSEDLKYARMVSYHIGSDHTEIVMTPSEFFDSIPAVIYDIESFDITTVRASVGNWLVAREIAKTDCKVVFNGDGSDELFGGYLYFHRAPSDEEFEDESNRLLKDIHLFDVYLH
jgi:asparagine synthase (glutamine-hydrolysing)